MDAVLTGLEIGGLVHACVAFQGQVGNGLIDNACCLDVQGYHVAGECLAAAAAACQVAGIFIRHALSMADILGKLVTAGGALDGLDAAAVDGDIAAG